MLARGWSFGVWALVAGSALFWGFRLLVKAPPVPTQAVVAELGVGARGDLSRVFGPDPVVALATAEPEPVADARFQLIGVVSPRNGQTSSQTSSQGVALIAVDGKPAKAYRVGAVVDGQTVLQSVRARGAALGPRGGAVQVALELAAPAAAATGLPGDPALAVLPAAPPPSMSRNSLPPGMSPGMPPGMSPGMSPSGPMRSPTKTQQQPQPDASDQPSSSMLPATR